MIRLLGYATKILSDENEAEIWKRSREGLCKNIELREKEKRARRGTRVQEEKDEAFGEDTGRLWLASEITQRGSIPPAHFHIMSEKEILETTCNLTSFNHSRNSVLFKLGASNKCPNFRKRKYSFYTCRGDQRTIPKP